MNTKGRRYRQHGTGSIRKISSEKWRIGYDVSAPGLPRKQRFETVRGSKKDAAAILGLRLENKRKHGVLEDDRLTFAQVVH